MKVEVSLPEGVNFELNNGVVNLSKNGKTVSKVLDNPIVKIVLEDMEVPIDIQEIAFIYNDLSLI